VFIISDQKIAAIFYKSSTNVWKRNPSSLHANSL